MELKLTRMDVDAQGIATVLLDRPGRANSWTARMHAELRWCCAQLDPDPAVRVIVIRGAGRFFCAGADAKALEVLAEPGSDYVSSTKVDVDGPNVAAEFDADLLWLAGLSTPTIAAINGACAGIAVALASFCDLRIGVEGAKITTVAPRLALPAEYGLSWMLPRLIGVTRSADLLLTGRVVLAEEMRDWGFFNSVVPAAQFDDAVATMAGHFLACAPAAVALTKAQLWGDLLHGDVRRAVVASKDLIGVQMNSADFAEAVQARAENRAPIFGPA